jgi:DNA polymerase-3 subunit gamma/tau
VAEIVARLRTLCAQEGLEVEEAALELVARQATGALRDAISLLDQLVASGSSVTLERAQELLGVAANQAVQRLAEAMAEGDTAAGLECLNEAVDAGADPRQLARQMVDYLRGLLMVRLGNAALVEMTADARMVMARQAERFEVSALLRAIRAFNSAASDVRGGWQPRLPLEMAVVECTTPLGATAGPEPAAGVSAPVPVANAAGASRTADPVTSAPPSGSEPPASTLRPVAEPAAADLGAAWKRLLALMRERDKATEALLRSCTVVGFEGNVLRLATQAQLVHDKLTNHAATRQLITTLLTEVMGRPCGVACQMANTRPSRKADAGHVPAEGMVATALRDLGGEIAE